MPQVRVRVWVRVRVRFRFGGNFPRICNLLENNIKITYLAFKSRGGSRAAATSKMERFLIIVNGWNQTILNVAAALDPPLKS